jgi:hypothetical protein
MGGKSGTTVSSFDDGRADVDVFPANGPLVTTSYGYRGRLSSVQTRSAEPASRYAVREAAYALDGCGVWPNCVSSGTWSCRPTFDIAHPAIFLLPHQDAAWKIIKERLDGLQQACASISQREGLGALGPLAGKLQSMSQDISSHGA